MVNGLIKLMRTTLCPVTGSSNASALAVIRKCREGQPALEVIEREDDEMPNVKVLPKTTWSWHINTCHHKPYAEAGIGVRSGSKRSVLKHGFLIEGSNSIDDNVMDKL